MTQLNNYPVRIDFLPGDGIYENYLKLLGIYGDPTRLTLAEAEQAKRQNDSLFQESPEIFFRRAHCYAATRWFLDQKDEKNPPSELRAMAVREIFFGACDFEMENDLGSITKGLILAFRRRGELRAPEDVMPMRILLHGGREILERAIENIPQLTDQELLAILGDADPVHLAAHEELLFPLAQELERRGIRHEKAGRILLRALKRTETKWLTQALRLSKKEKEKIEGNLGIIPFLRSLRQELEGDKEPQKSPLKVPEKPPDLTLSMKCAYFMGHVAKPSKALLEELAAIASSDRYSDGTRAHIVAAMRRLALASGDRELQSLVAIRLFQILNGRHLSRYQDVWGWTLREALESLKEIPFRITGTGVRILKYYLFNTEQPIGSLLAVAVLGKKRLSSSGSLRESIDQGLLDAMNMPRQPLVQRAAAVWLNRK